MPGLIIIAIMPEWIRFVIPDAASSFDTIFPAWREATDMALTYDHSQTDTIAAIATAMSEAGIGIIRISRITMMIHIFFFKVDVSFVGVLSIIDGKGINMFQSILIGSSVQHKILVRQLDPYIYIYKLTYQRRCIAHKHTCFVVAD